MGDKNTGYFHATTKSRNHVNRITVIEDDQGVAQFEPTDVAVAISSYYHTLFTSEGDIDTHIVDETISPCIFASTNEFLITVPNREEILRAIKETHPEKAPGPDGFPTGFFTVHWDTFGVDFIENIQKIFLDDEIPTKLNNTFVRLIPKILNP